MTPLPPTPNDPNVKVLSPEGLANQLFDGLLLQTRGDPQETARQVIVFLRESLIYAISSSAGDETARKALLKSVGDSITVAPPPVRPGAPKP